MADVEAQASETAQIPVQVEAEVQINDLETAVEQLLNNARIVGGLKAGCNEVIKSIEAGTAYYVFIASDIEEKKIGELITLLAKKHNIAVIEVPSAKDLGKWCGLGKMGRDGTMRNISGASSASIIKLQKSSQALNYIKNYVATMQTA